MPGKNTNVRPTIGTQLNVTMMKNIKKPLVTGGITAGVTVGDHLSESEFGDSASIMTSAGVNNASIDLGLKMRYNNWGSVISTGLSYVQGNQNVTYPAVDVLVEPLLRKKLNEDFISETANAQLVVADHDMKVRMNGETYKACAGEALNINIPEASERFFNKQLSWYSKYGALYVNDKRNFELQFGARLDIVNNWAPKLERMIKGTVEETYQVFVDDFAAPVIDAKREDIVLGCWQQPLRDKDFHCCISPYAAINYNLANGLNLTAEASLMGGTVGINYMF